MIQKANGRIQNGRINNDTKILPTKYLCLWIAVFGILKCPDPENSLINLAPEIISLITSLVLIKFSKFFFMCGKSILLNEVMEIVT